MTIFCKVMTPYGTLLSEENRFFAKTTVFRDFTHVVNDHHTMFWRAQWLYPSCLSAVPQPHSKTSESYTYETTGTDETQEVSSVQCESSGSDSNLNLRVWLLVKSLVTNSSFSDAFSDKVTIDQQRKEEQNGNGSSPR